MPATIARRQGLSAVPILVALVVIVLLVLSLLPATQSAREASRRAAAEAARREAVIWADADKPTAPSPFIVPERAAAAPPPMMMAGMVPPPPGTEPTPEAPPIDKPGAPVPPGISRKIVYNAEVSVVVEDFATAEPEVGRLVEAAGGYVAELNVTGSPGSQRSARWRVRIPVERFEQFIEDIKKLGELERNQRTSEDVTEKYYDTEARLKNKRVEEETLVGILKDRGGKLEDVLKVEVELSRVRGEIEQLEGHLRLLANLSSLTTVTINVREREKFQPPPPIAPDFATLVARTFRQSVDRLVDLGKAFVLACVAVAPWLPLIVAGVVLVWFAGGRIGRLARRAWIAAQTPLTPPRSGSGLFGDQPAAPGGS
jgi:hypothetical protein